jgi:hypothetical protein
MVDVVEHEAEVPRLTDRLRWRIDFNQIIKKKFISQIKRNLYEAHKDFISRPLLATMML